MNETFKVLPLRCDHCGGALPVMGHYVTFQCGTCFRYWVLTGDGLRPITVYRALPPAESESDPVLIPFWVIPVDCEHLRKQMESILGELREVTRIIATSDFEMEEQEFEDFSLVDDTVTPEMKRAQFLTEATRTKNVPSAGEVGYLLRRIEGAGTFLVYVPAFQSTNTHACLKVGRLFTRRQPQYRIERSSGLGHPVLCSLQADEAVSLVDYVFFATLPGAIQMNGDFLKQIHLKAAEDPRLIEFPFERRGASLVSRIGGFDISTRLIEGISAQTEMSSRP
jgi:hypothetical protein